MKKYKVKYKDAYDETHITRVEANNEREAEIKFNENCLLDIIISIVPDKLV